MVAGHSPVQPVSLHVIPAQDLFIITAISSRLCRSDARRTVESKQRNLSTGKVGSNSLTAIRCVSLAEFGHGVDDLLTGIYAVNT